MSVSKKITFFEADGGQGTSKASKNGQSAPSVADRQKSTSKTLVLKKSSPSEVKEFKNGRVRRRAVFEDDEQAEPGSKEGEDGEAVEYDDSSDESEDLDEPVSNKVKP